MRSRFVVQLFIILFISVYAPWLTRNTCRYTLELMFRDLILLNNWPFFYACTVRRMRTYFQSVLK